jgi:hypothetical protein
MSDDHRKHYARMYKSFLDENIELLGAESITPLRRQIAKNLALLMCEQAAIQDRLSSSRGGNAEDLSLFLKISDQVSTLLKSVGLDRPAKQVATEPESGVEKLVDLLNGIVRSRTVQPSASPLPSPSPAPLLPTPDLIASPSPIAPSVGAKVPDAIPAPIEPNATQLYYRWRDAGGESNGYDMSIPSTFPVLK